MKRKKQDRNLYRTNSSGDMEYNKIIKITVGVLIVLVITYFATAILSGEIKFGSKEKEEVKEETSIQYEEITVGQMLNRVDSEYYVLLFDFTDTYASYYLSMMDSYTNKDDSVPFHIIDLEKHVNKDYVLQDGEELIEKPVRLVDFKATNPTVVRIKNRKIVERITGKDKVLEFFEEKTK